MLALAVFWSAKAIPFAPSVCRMQKLLLGPFLALLFFTEPGAVLACCGLLWITFSNEYNWRWHERDWTFHWRLTPALIVLAASAGGWILFLRLKGLLGDYLGYIRASLHARPVILYATSIGSGRILASSLGIEGFLTLIACLTIFLIFMVAVMRWVIIEFRSWYDLDTHWAGGLWGAYFALGLVKEEPEFTSIALACFGCFAFVLAGYGPNPRYLLTAFQLCYFILPLGAEELIHRGKDYIWVRRVGQAVLALTILVSVTNAAQLVNYAFNPDYSLITAARNLTAYIDAHPNGNRLLVSSIAGEVQFITKVPAIRDDSASAILAQKLRQYDPGWFATWNDIDPDTLESLHRLYSLEQVASFTVGDKESPQTLVLFELHRLAVSRIDNSNDENLRASRAGDRIGIPIRHR